MLLDDIIKYEPYNEQETQDKIKFIKFLKNDDNCFSRKNIDAHITSSCWIINEQHNKVLMCYHKIYDSYSWLGGHNDDSTSCLNTAIKELKEESGLKQYKLLSNDIFSIEILPVKEHVKNGKIVKKHLHYNITYLFECSDTLELIVNEKENSDLKWFTFDELKDNIKELNMYNNVYSKLIAKLRK